MLRGYVGFKGEPQLVTVPTARLGGRRALGLSVRRPDYGYGVTFLLSQTRRHAR